MNAVHWTRTLGANLAKAGVQAALEREFAGLLERLVSGDLFFKTHTLEQLDAWSKGTG